MTETTKTELDTLKEQADMLGISYAKNVTTKTLKKLIAEHYQEELTDDANQERFDLEKDKLKLVKVIIMPNDTAKQGQSGEIFCVGNSVLGTITRFIPYGEEWLIENMMYESIKEREYQLMVSKRNAKGEEYVESKMMPAYSIQVLPLPTKEEIEELAKLQQARNTIE